MAFEECKYYGKEVPKNGKVQLTLKLGKCSNCHQITDNLLLSYCKRSDEGHLFCLDCFKITNKTSSGGNMKCPCCRDLFCNYGQSLDECILIGEGNYTSYEARYEANQGTKAEYVYRIREKAIEQYDAALVMNPTNYVVIDSLNKVYIDCLEYCAEAVHNPKVTIQATIERKRLNQKLHNSCLFVIDHYLTIEPPDFNLLTHNCLLLARMFESISNYAASMKYYKSAYEYCLRSTDRTQLEELKHDYTRIKEQVAEESPLRFTVGDVVECYIESADGEGGVHKFGKVNELHYRESSFPLEITAPYRIELCPEHDSADQPPVYTWVKADIDRYVRRVSVKIIEEARHRARLNAKVKELAQVYCSKEFMLEIYRTLKQDQAFVDRLRSEWEIELTQRVVCLYRMLIMYRQPMVQTDTGYYVPTTAEVIAEIKNYFTRGTVTKSTRFNTKDIEIMILRSPDKPARAMLKGSDTAISHYIRFFTYYLEWYKHDRTTQKAGVDHYMTQIEGGFSLPPPVSCLSPSVLKAFSTAKPHQFAGIAKESGSADVAILAQLWTAMCSFIEKCDTELAAECPFIYFFVKYCLDYGMGVPKAALAVRDRMNMQLSREFIRCANPACQHNKLDQSTGLVKFKKCSRCEAVNYCSRECQVAHFPVHKKSCKR